MRVVAVIQARMGSTRFPGKVLADLSGKPMLVRMLERVERCKRIDDWVVATPAAPEGTPIGQVVRHWHPVRVAEDDVLSRYVSAAREWDADVVVRLTADCPLIDPAVVDSVVDLLTSSRSGLDYACNFLPRTFPQGLDCEAMWTDTLERLDRRATDPRNREHVTTYLYESQPRLFVAGNVTTEGPNFSAYRWTVDTPADLAHIRDLWAALGMGERFVGWREIAEYEQRAAFALARS